MRDSGSHLTSERRGRQAGILSAPTLLRYCLEGGSAVEIPTREKSQIFLYMLSSIIPSSTATELFTAYHRDAQEGK